MFWNNAFLSNDFVAPYALNQDLESPFAPLSVPGAYAVKAEAFDENNTWLGTEVVTFVVTEAGNLDGVIAGLKVVDLADPSRNFGFLRSDTVILQQPSLTIEIVTNRPVFQVSMFFDDEFVANDYELPYALGQDTASPSNAFEPLSVPGTHSVKVEAFDEGNAWLETKSFTFTVSGETSRDVPMVTSSSQGDSLQDIPILPPAPPQGVSDGGPVLGELRKWHKITIPFTGPYVRESDSNNPFLNYRLDVTFSHQQSDKTYVVPGFFAADGNAAETSASEGNVWHCNFTPDEEGTWSYKASFVTGGNVAVADSASAGSPTSFHGQSGSFLIGSTNKTGRDHRGSGYGRLEYVGEHHLRFGEGRWFLKAGADR